MAFFCVYFKELNCYTFFYFELLSIARFYCWYMVLFGSVRETELATLPG